MDAWLCAACGEGGGIWCGPEPAVGCDGGAHSGAAAAAELVPCQRAGVAVGGCCERVSVACAAQHVDAAAHAPDHAVLAAVQTVRGEESVGEDIGRRFVLFDCAITQTSSHTHTRSHTLSFDFSFRDL